MTVYFDGLRRWSDALAAWVEAVAQHEAFKKDLNDLRALENLVLRRLDETGVRFPIVWEPDIYESMVDYLGDPLGATL